MNVFKNKFLRKLIAALCLFLTLINFGMSNKVFAEEKVTADILVTPITKLLTALSDGIITLLQTAVLRQEVSIIEISGASDYWDNWGAKALKAMIVIALIGVTAFLLPGGLAVGLLVAGTVEVATAIAFGERSCFYGWNMDC